MLQSLFTLNEISASLKVSISTLRRAIRAGELSHVRAGKRGLIRVSQESVEQWLHDRASRAPSSSRKSACNVENQAPLQRAQNHGVSVLEGNVGESLSYRLINADVVEGLRSLESDSISMMATSPPYYWQRDYEVDGQIGQEPTIECYVNALVETFDEAKRVLAKDGVLFLNLGDAYYNAKGKPHGRDSKHSARQFARKVLRAVDGPGLGLPRKSLIGLPWRVALALQERGWTLRSSVIWHRPNSLGEPTSRDRPWRTHENLFIFSKGPKYYFDRSPLEGEEDIWVIPARPDNPFSHCAPFPEELVRRCIACGCPPGGTVLDMFSGSGTTVLEALRAGCGAVGIELSSRFIQESEQRILDSFGRNLTRTHKK